MKGWTQLCSDMNWIDYHGMWARKARDGSWYVLQWNNLVDAGGREFEDTPYGCDVKRLDLSDTPRAAIDSALRSCGYRLEEAGSIVNESGDIVLGHLGAEPAIVECCIQYGLGAPLESFTGSKYPERIRASARRYAEQCMRDAALLEERLERPVNAIGSTAAEYGRGDIDSALHRGPFDDSKRLIRKLSGFPT